MDWEHHTAPCPGRQFGLTHIRDDRRNDQRRCIYCNVTLRGFDDDSPGGAVAMPDAQDAENVMTFPDILIRLGLIQPLRQVKADPFELAPDCIVDHDSLLAWAVCASCGLWHEPKLGPGTPADGTVVTFTRRQKDRLEKTSLAFNAGFYQS